MLHDDHVDGLNHDLGLLGARFHGLSALGKTGGLGNGSSLGSEGSDLSTSRLHLLLVSGVSSEFGMVSSHAHGLRGSLVLSDDSGGYISRVGRGTTSDGLPGSHFPDVSGSPSFLEGSHFLDVSGSLSFLGCFR